MKLIRIMIILLVFVLPSASSNAETFYPPYNTATLFHTSQNLLDEGAFGVQAGAIVDQTHPDGEYDPYGFRSSCMAITKGIGFVWIEGAICLNIDEYRIPLQEEFPTGKYRVKINYTLAGYVVSPRSGFEPLGGSGGTQFDISVRGEVLEKFPDGYYSHVDGSFLEYIYEKEWSLADAVAGILWDGAENILKYGVSGSGYVTALANITELYNIAATAASTLPDKVFLPQNPRNIEFDVDLEQGKEYRLDFRMYNKGWSAANSSVSAIQMAASSIAVKISSIEIQPIVLTGGAPPQIDNFFHTGTPYPVVYNGQLHLSVSASDPDGSVNKVGFYRDTNKTGVLDDGDEFLGSDSSPQGGQWDWSGLAHWSPGTNRFFARAQDDEGLWGNGASELVTIGMPPVSQGGDFTQTGENWDDGTAQGDGDGVMEAGEKLRLWIRLRSDSGAEDVQALLSTSDSNVTISNPEVYFRPFTNGESQWSIGSFEMELDFGLNAGATWTSEFAIQVTYELGGQEYVQELPFSKTFYRDGDIRADFEVIPPITMDDDPAYSFRNNGDGILQSGEVARMRPTVRNIGQNGATDPDIEFYFSGAGESPVEIRGGFERYEDIAAGATALLPQAGESFRVIAVDQSFIGTVNLGMRVDWDENGNAGPLDITDALQLTVAPASIVAVLPEEWNFGVVASGEPVNYTMTIMNGGSAILEVSDIQTSDGDTSVLPEDTSFDLPPGGSRNVVVSLDTSAIFSGTSIERQITVISNGRLDDDVPPSDRFILTGLVSNAAVVFPKKITVAPGADQPDISGDVIVYQDPRYGNLDIFTFRPAAGVETRITMGANYSQRPKISGDLIVWEEYVVSGTPYLYAFDLSNPGLGTFSVAPGIVEQRLAGVNGNLVAFCQEYDTVTDRNGTEIAHNLLVYEYIGGGEFMPRYNTNWSAGADTADRQSVRCGQFDSDFGNGLLVFEQYTLKWLENSTWGYEDSHVRKIDYAESESSPSRLFSPNSYSNYSASSRGFAYVFDYEDPEGNNGDQVWLWEDGSIRRLTEPGTDEVNHGSAILATGDSFVVYDKNGAVSQDKLFFWDLSESQTNYPERLLTENGGQNPESARMDGGAVVWRGQNPDDSQWYVYFAFRNCDGVQWCDTTPVAFSFVDDTNVALSTLQISNTITVAGINNAAAISVSAGGEYSINGEAFTSTAGTANNGDTVAVRHTSSGLFSTQTNTVVTIGGVTDTYSSTTLAIDTAPDAFNFSDDTNVTLSTMTTSDTITVADINSAANISVVGGEYSINGGVFISTASTVNNGDTVAARHTSSGLFSTQTNTVVTIGGVNGTYSSTTLVEDTSAIDSDNDGLPDSWEMTNFGNLVTANGTTDTDNDGLLDVGEYAYSTNPNNTDTDGDGDSDGDEVLYGSDPVMINDTLDSRRPYAPVMLSVSGEAALREQVFDVEGFGDPNQAQGDYLSASEWEISTDQNFTNTNSIFYKTLEKNANNNEVDYRQLLMPDSILVKATDYWVRTRHRDSVGLWSAWSTPVVFSTVAADLNDLDDDGIDDRYQVTGDTDTDGNGVDDSTEGIRALYEAEGGTTIGMRAGSGTLGGLTAVPDTDIPSALMPADAMTYGLFSFRVDGLPVDALNPATADVTFYFPKPLPSGTKWYKYDSVNGAMTDFTANVAFSGNQAIVTLRDGSAGDADGVINGVIVDPSGPTLLPAGSTDGSGNSSASGGGGGGGGGGCSISRHDASIDPILPLLMIWSLFYLIRRRYGVQTGSDETNGQ